MTSILYVFVTELNNTVQNKRLTMIWLKTLEFLTTQVWQLYVQTWVCSTSHLTSYQNCFSKYTKTQ